MRDYRGTLRPWEQQDDESDKAYRGFRAWRNLTGNRTLLRAHKEYIGNKYAGQAPDYFRHWFHDYDWEERTRAWDRYCRNREDKAYLTAREESACERGFTLAELEAKSIEVACKIAEILQEKLQSKEFWNSIRPQHIAPLMRALCWVVERAFSWLSQNRRLSKDYERLCATSEAFVYAAMTRLRARRFARA